MDTAEKIKYLRKKNHLTLEEVGRACGVGKSTVQKWESGAIENMRRDKIAALADILQTTPSYLMGWNEETEEGRAYDLQPLRRKRFPLLGEIACGQPIYAAEDRESYVMAGTDINADFCLVAKGDSMTGARILDGDIVFIRKQDMVDNGEIAAVVIGDEATLKRVNYYPEKNLLILKADNPLYPDQIYADDQLDAVQILGKAVAFQSDVR